VIVLNLFCNYLGETNAKKVVVIIGFMFFFGSASASWLAGQRIGDSG
jgi:hypothetical protein